MELQTNRLRDPFLPDLGCRITKKGSSNLKNHTDTKRTCWTPFCKISAPKRSKKEPNKLLPSEKKEPKVCTKILFKTVQNSKDALKGHQANSKISSGTLFWGPQSLFVPTTTTTTTTTNTRAHNKPLHVSIYIWYPPWDPPQSLLYHVLQDTCTYIYIYTYKTHTHR